MELLSVRGCSHQLFQRASGGYYDIFEDEAINDGDSWDPASYIGLIRVYSYGTSDQINTANSDYGDTGWLGLASISNSGRIINYGESVLNEFYLEQAQYTQTNRKHVACQEIGHQFGLDHQDGTTTCMSNSYGWNQPQPDAHDVDMIATIYSVARYYGDINYGGGSLDQRLTGSDPSLASYGWNDLISSVYVKPGYTVVLYEHENYGGASLTLTSDAVDLRSYSGPGADGTWNDVASSVSVF